MVLDSVIILGYFEEVIDEVGGIVMKQKASSCIYAKVSQKAAKLTLQNGQLRDVIKYEITVRMPDIDRFKTAQEITYNGKKLKAQGLPAHTRGEFTTLTALEA